MKLLVFGCSVTHGCEHKQIANNIYKEYYEN